MMGLIMQGWRHAVVDRRVGGTSDARPGVELLREVDLCSHGAS
jgi:hypothetical protein